MVLVLLLLLVLVYFSFSSAIREKKRGWLVGREQESQVYISSSEVQFD